MIRLLKKILVIISILIVVLIVWVFRPYEKADIAMVDPRLRTFEEPCRQVIVHYLSDFGSMGIELIDSRDQRFEFCLRISRDKKGVVAYRELFIGSTDYTDKKASKVVNEHHTRIRLAEVLRTIPGDDDRRDEFIYRLCGRVRDAFRIH
jgi:hypothetical protein